MGSQLASAGTTGNTATGTNGAAVTNAPPMTVTLTDQHSNTNGVPAP